MTEMDGTDYIRRRQELVNYLKKRGYIRSERVYAAMMDTPREKFVPYVNRKYSYADTPLQIKGGQTISAPHMVAEMCSVAELETGNNVLEVGAGSGYNAAVMAKLVIPGIVHSTDIVPSLTLEARKNLESAGTKNVVVSEHDGSTGLPAFAPYDRIIVTCASPGIPTPLVKQLAPNGLLVIPVGDRYLQTLIVVRKDEKGKVTREKRLGCVFVEMKGKHGFR